MRQQAPLSYNNLGARAPSSLVPCPHIADSQLAGPSGSPSIHVAEWPLSIPQSAHLSPPKQAYTDHPHLPPSFYQSFIHFGVFASICLGFALTGHTLTMTRPVPIGPRITKYPSLAQCSIKIGCTANSLKVAFPASREDNIICRMVLPITSQKSTCMQCHLSHQAHLWDRTRTLETQLSPLSLSFLLTSHRSKCSFLEEFYFCPQMEKAPCPDPG